MVFLFREDADGSLLRIFIVEFNIQRALLEIAVVNNPDIPDGNVLFREKCRDLGDRGNG